MKTRISLYAIAIVAAFSACTNDEPQRTAQLELGFDLESFDSTVAPCEDFFQYISGGWVEKNPVPETEGRWGNFNILIEENNRKVRGLLDSVSNVAELEKGSYQQLVADYYKSGMDSMAIEEAGIKALQPIFKRIDEVNDHKGYALLNAYFKGIGVKHPWSTYVGIDDKNSEQYILHLGQSGLGLPDRDYYLKDDSASMETQAAYREHIAKMFVLKGDEDEVATQKSNAIYDLEKQLAEVSMSRVDRRQPENTYNKMGKEQVMELSPGLINKLFFEENTIIFDSAIITQPDYIKALDKILAQQDVNTLKAYAQWHVIDGYAGFLPHAFVKQNFEFFSKTLRGTKKMKPRWRRTLGTVGGGLGEQLGHLFVDRYFPESSKKDIEEMVENFRVAYRERIEQLEWMSDETKTKAREKLDAFKYKIGYPSQWKDYSDLEISANSYIQNGMSMSAYQIKENIAKLGTPVDKDEWFMPAYIVNAYYSSSHNEIVFPAGILQPPFYNAAASPAINYGAIGGVIGHEFTHGFDDQGRKYNAFGNLADWWTLQDKDLFEKRTNKMVVQYSDYEPIKSTFVNGRLTLGENIADLGGLTLAYYGYQNAINGEEQPLVDGFTWQQQVFLGWGQVWQSSQTDAYTSQQVVTDPHSPAKYRVNGPMSNMVEFREAWGCSGGDPMVRPDSLRVSIW